jgi:MtN3 and saliva related transmembrane protein
VDLSATSLVALLAGTLTTIAFVPQVVRAWRTQSVDDLSLAMLLTFSSGVALWVYYGMLVEEPPMILTNGVTLFLALMLVGMKLRGR